MKRGYVLPFFPTLEWVATCASSTNRTYQDSLLFVGLNVLDPYLSISHRICEAPPPRSIRRVLPHPRLAVRPVNTGFSEIITFTDEPLMLWDGTNPVTDSPVAEHVDVALLPTDYGATIHWRHQGCNGNLDRRCFEG
jgi:hypothetical protein